MNNPTGIYKPKNSRYWWYSAGRGLRRSSRSVNIEDAIAQREQALALKGRKLVSEDWRLWVSAQREDSNSWLRRTHARMRRKTAIRKWGSCLTLQELTTLTLASDGRCALTGLQFARRPSSPRHPFSISVDRIESSRGYEPGNVRVILLAVNLAMSHWGENALREISRALVGRELTEATQTCGSRG